MRLENTFIGAQGVGPTTERRLWQEGVTHWDEFDPSYVGPKTGERLAAFIERGRDSLDRGDSRFFAEALPSGERYRLYENFRDRAVFFDIETTGLSKQFDDVTCVSFYQGSETTTLVNGDDLTREAVAERFDAPLIVSFNGASFDVPFLEQSYDLSIDAPHMDLMHVCRGIGLTGGLKSIEKEIGLERDRPDISGRDAVRLWREHERGVDGSLDTLVSYNREDTVNLQTLADHTAECLHRDVFEASLSG
jgi:uncharacterized protein YprB with RNaseH-like and TPR domain